MNKRVWLVLIGISLVATGCQAQDTFIPAPGILQSAKQGVPITPVIAPDAPPAHEVSKVSVLFMIDRSESVRELCSEAQEELGFHVPELIAAFLKTLANYSGSAEWPKIGAIGFLKNVLPKRSTFFPMIGAQRYSPELAESFENYLKDEFQWGAGNNFEHALITGEQLLEDTGADKKILVLITDGWFINMTDDRSDTMATLQEEVRKKGTTVLMIRQDCPIGQKYNHPLKEQKNDDANWEAFVRDENYFSPKDSSDLADFISHPAFMSLLPLAARPLDERTGTWNESTKTTQALEIPGDTWQVRLEAATIGVRDIKVQNLNEQMVTNVQGGPLGGGVFELLANLDGPDRICTETNERFLMPASSLTYPAFMFYWWVPESIDRNVQIMTPAEPIYITNREAFKIAITGIVKDGFPIKDLESFAGCYRITARLIDREMNVQYVIDQLALKELFPSLSVAGNWSKEIQLSSDFPALDHQKKLELVLDVEKLYEHETVVLQSKKEDILVNFRPILREFRWDPERSGFTVSVDYAEPFLYDDADFSFQIWGLSVFSHDDMEGDRNNKRKKCDLYYPDPTYEVSAPANGGKLFASGLCIAGSCLDGFGHSTNWKQVLVPMTKGLVNDCGFEKVSIQWEGSNNLFDSSLRTAILCEFDTGICTESDDYWVHSIK